MWKAYLVFQIVKSRSQCPISAVSVENVEVLPGTYNTDNMIQFTGTKSASQALNVSPSGLLLQS